MTISQWIKASSLAPRIAAMLIKHIIARSINLDAQSFVVAHANDTLTPDQITNLDSAKNRIQKSEPLQYIIGSTEFRNLSLKTDSRALIPRPETEELVELVIEHLKAYDLQPAGQMPLWAAPSPHMLTIADIGTGSGAIALSLADWATKNEMPLHIIATDTSDAALKLAQENYNSILKFKNLNLKLEFRKGYLLKPISKKMDIIIANLPYIPTHEIPHLDQNVKDFEPRIALDGGPDGLSLIRDLLRDAPRVLKPGGKIFLEIWHEHTIKDFEQCHNYHVEIKRDTCDHNRFGILTLRS